MAPSMRNKSVKIADKGDRATVAPPLLQQAVARLGWRSIADGLLGGVGGATAVICASFAIYMSYHPRPAFNGLEHLMIFAQPNYQDPASVADAAPLADRKDIDYIATGTIHAASAAPPPPSISTYRSSAVTGCITFGTVRRSSLAKTMRFTASDLGRWCRAWGASSQSSGGATNGSWSRRAV